MPCCGLNVLAEGGTLFVRIVNAGTVPVNVTLQLGDVLPVSYVRTTVRIHTSPARLDLHGAI